MDELDYTELMNSILRRNSKLDSNKELETPDEASSESEYTSCEFMQSEMS